MSGYNVETELTGSPHRWHDRAGRKGDFQWSEMAIWVGCGGIYYLRED